MGALTPYPRLNRRAVAKDFGRVLEAPPASLGARGNVAFYKSQGLARSIYWLESVLGYKFKYILDFVSTGDFSAIYSSLLAIDNGWKNSGKIVILSLPIAATKTGDDPLFASATTGTGVYTATLDGTLNPIWDRVANMGRNHPKMILRFPGWEITATYFPSHPNDEAGARQYRLAGRQAIDRIKSTGPNAQYAAGMEVWFNPECGNGIGIPGTYLWLGVVVFSAAGTTPAAPPATRGLVNDWFRYRNTTTGVITCYKKVGSVADEASGTALGTWELQSGVSEPIIPAIDNYSPYLDANGNQYRYADIVGSEAYIGNYDKFNDTNDLLWQNRVLGFVSGDASHKIVEGVDFWYNFALEKNCDWAIGECGAGQKIDFPGYMDVINMAGCPDNPEHIRRLGELAAARNARFICLWDQDAPDFGARMSRTPRLTGLPISTGRDLKELQGAEMVRQFGSPEAVARLAPFDATNEKPGVPVVTWVVNKDAVNVPYETIVAHVDIPNAATCKRYAFNTFGSDGTGYGSLAIREGLTVEGLPDKELRLRSPRLSGPYTFYVRASNELGPTDSGPITYTVVNATATFGQTSTAGTDLTPIAGSLALIPITTPAQQQILLRTLELVAGTGANTAHRVRPVVFRRTGTTIGALVATGTDDAMPAAGVAKALTVNGSFIDLQPSTDYFIGFWVSGASPLKTDTAGSTTTANVTYSATNNPGTRTNLATTTGAIYCKASFEY